MTSTDHAAQLVNTFGDLFKNNVLTDVTLVCDDKIRIEAHRIVLCAGSTMFRDLLVDTAKQHPLLYLKGIKTEHLDPLLQYLYYGEATIPQNKINEFLSVSKDLEILMMTRMVVIQACKTKTVPTLDQLKQRKKAIWRTV